MHKQALTQAYDIVCPKCKTRQTAFIKLSIGHIDIYHAETTATGETRSNISYQLTKGIPYILCVNRWGCQHLIVGDELDEVTTFRVTCPSDIRKLKQAQLI
ncbi:hypothetical protein SAMN05192574_101360 [Mucilaginibacter gossypiicola]|uniref:Uncharacterized protein n=1 Tax=Mucilaginibacter gossypiicola TaxID=551995 RepID=A0A1H8A7F1_9SPHI|nr:hypothetical protein [Mucilaginibacter gossypiicola]SEM65728.1 hypothetical protein SAMN05192574_101360 [Mucilaginibacter gossypiicola]